MALKSGSVREKLLMAASDLFSRKGYAASTVREIVAAAGVTKPALYYYFKNKEAIYLHLLRETFSKLEQLIDATASYRGSTEEKLKNLLAQTFSLFLENLDVAKVMYWNYYGPQQGAPLFDFDSYHLKLIRAVRQLVEEGIDQKELFPGNPEHIAWVLLGALLIAMDLRLTHPEWGLDHRGLEEMLTLIYRGIALEKERRKGEEK